MTQVRKILWTVPLAASLIACSSEMNMPGMNMPGMGGDAGTPSSKSIASISYDALYVVNGGDSTVTVIDTEKNEVAGTIALENAMYPHHLYLSSDRMRLALAIPGMDLSGGHEGGMHGMKGAVLLMDATNGAPLGARVLDAMNHNAVFASGDKEIWSSQMDMPGIVVVLDAATLETKQSIGVGAQPAEVTFSKDGKYVFVANGGSNTVSVIDANTKEVVKTIDVGEDPVGAWQGNNGVAYVDNEKAKTLSAIDVMSLTVKTTYDLGFTPGMAALAPDGMLWVTDAENGKVILNMPAEDMKMGEVVTGAGAHGIAFSGDGKTGYVSNQFADTVSVIDVASRKVVKALPVGAKPNGMVWRAK